MDIELQNLICRYDEYDEAEKRFIEEQVIHKCKYYVLHILKKYRNSNYYEDLVQDLNIIILKSIRKYNKNSKASFETYVYRAMVNKISIIYKEYLSVRLPAHVEPKGNIVNTVSNLIKTRNGEVHNLYDNISRGESIEHNIIYLNCLTNKEKFIIQRLYMGYSDREIGMELGVTHQAVNLRKQNIKKKLIKEGVNI